MQLLNDTGNGGPMQSIDHAGFAIKAERVRWVVVLCIHTCAPFEERILHEWMGVLVALIKTEYWDRAGRGGNISYDW